MTAGDTTAAVPDDAADDNATEPEPNNTVRGDAHTGLGAAAAAAGVTPTYSALQAEHHLDWGQISGASRLADMVAKSDSFAQIRAANAMASSMTRSLPRSTFGELSGANRMANLVAKSGAFSHFPEISTFPRVMPKIDIAPTFNLAFRAAAGTSKLNWGELSGANRMANLVAKSGAFSHFPEISTIARVMPKIDIAPTFNFLPKIDVWPSTFSALISQIGELDLEGLLERHRPRNLRAGELNLERIEELMKHEGLPFCLVPDEETADLLLAAEDRPARRRVLVERAGLIFDVCEDVVGLCVSPALVEQGTLIRKAVRAYGDGHPEAAQALATVVMDRLVGLYSHKGQIKNPADGATFIEGLPWREWFFLLPIPVVHDKTWQIVDRGLFNRNTTVHQVELAQLTASNAVQAIMLATSMLGFHQDLW